MKNTQTLSSAQTEMLIQTLKVRFEQNKSRHALLTWPAIETKLRANAGKLWSLSEMERTEGEPDVVGFDEKTGEYIFYDCSAESPKGRRSVCYDRKGLESRKEHQPAANAMDMATGMGISILTEQAYRTLQTLGEFDTKTSSWISTPAAIREHGGALFADRRYGAVFVYHNGAQSYYSARGFRGMLLL